jgi:hypothetical protein
MRKQLAYAERLDQVTKQTHNDRLRKEQEVRCCHFHSLFNRFHGHRGAQLQEDRLPPLLGKRNCMTQSEKWKLRNKFVE